MVLFGLGAGLWRGSLYQAKLAQFDHYYNHKVTITAVASQDAAYNKYKQLTFDAKNIVVEDTGQRLTGKVSIAGFGLNAVFAGDEVKVAGTLKSSLGSYQGRMSYAQLTLVAHHNSLVSDLRRRFTSGVQSALPEPLASFGMGLLIGQRNTLPTEVSQALLMVGLTHIIAVSGYNLTILLRSADKVAGKQSRRMKLLFSFGLVAVFLLFAGTSASIVRAAIVSMLSIMTGYYGRRFKPLVLILLAAAITGYANPYYVWSDTSWYLSFLAFYGVMILAPMIQGHWRKKWRESLVASVALESICAELMTLPFILHTFGQMSFIGLVANVLVVALVPLAMLLTLGAGLAGMFAAPIVGWLAWPARILLTYMLDIATMLSRLPHVFAQNIGFTIWQMLASYVLIGFVSVALHRKTKRHKHATITDKETKELDVRSLQMVHN
ncbi:MAG TPA: ComEC/Rec2 family competence protein [Candidatus Microsaccharimonas sp.]|nr:ComEC/Rec2 family competence protein [Candidatus Microsaccharimonas sp.]